MAPLGCKLDPIVAMQNKKDDLAFQVDLCTKKLANAEKLINGLGGEKTRWTANAEQLASDYINLTGDVIKHSHPPPW